MSDEGDGDVSSEEGSERFVDGPVVVFTWRNDPGWPVEYVSPNVERLFGYAPAELYDGDPTYAELIHDDDLDRVAEEVETHSDGGAERFSHAPYRMVTESGDVRWVLDYTRIVREDGEVVRYTGYVVDITERKERLGYLTDLNATIRSLHRALIGADSEASIRRDVCRSLAALEGFAGVWIGTVDPASSSLAPGASAGVEREFLEALPRSLDTDSPSPAVRVAADSSPGSRHGCPDEAPETPWGTAMRAAGYRSALSVPVRHDGIRHGVLTVYGADPEGFDDRVRDVLIELGELVGYAIAAVERRDALHAEGGRELAVGVAVERDDPLRRLAAGVSATVDVRSVNGGSDSPLLYCLIDGVDPDRVLEVAGGVPGIGSIECLSDAETPLYEVSVVEPCTASAVSALGASLRSLRVSGDDCELVVSVRRGRDRRRLVERAGDLFGEAELRAERDITPSDATPWPALLADVLTDRQRSVLRAAYHAGYFDGNRKRTGAEVADSLGIAQPTFSAHVRAAVRNLLSAIWDAPGNE
jgi:PAS domain S-box-containing protein